MTDSPPHRTSPRPINLDALFDTPGSSAGQLVLVAHGGFCAPHMLPPWEHPDRGWAATLNVARWLFPRWTQLELAAREARRRARVCRRVLATGSADLRL